MTAIFKVIFEASPSPSPIRETARGRLRAPALARSLHDLSKILSGSCAEILLLTLGTCALYLINGMLGALQIYDAMTQVSSSVTVSPEVSKDTMQVSLDSGQGGIDRGQLSMGLQNLFLAITGFLRAMALFR